MNNLKGGSNEKGVAKAVYKERQAQVWRGCCGWAAASRFGIAQGGTTTRVIIDSSREIAPIDHHLFGSFLEHLGRAIYEGVYEPGSKFADANGFERT